MSTDKPNGGSSSQDWLMYIAERQDAMNDNISGKIKDIHLKIEEGLKEKCDKEHCGDMERRVRWLEKKVNGALTVISTAWAAVCLWVSSKG